MRNSQSARLGWLLSLVKKSPPSPEPSLNLPGQHPRVELGPQAVPGVLSSSHGLPCKALAQMWLWAEQCVLNQPHQDKAQLWECTEGAQRGTQALKGCRCFPAVNPHILTMSHNADEDNIVPFTFPLITRLCLSQSSTFYWVEGNFSLPLASEILGSHIASPAVLSVGEINPMTQHSSNHPFSFSHQLLFLIQLQHIIIIKWEEAESTQVPVEVVVTAPHAISLLLLLLPGTRLTFCPPHNHSHK